MALSRIVDKFPGIQQQNGRTLGNAVAVAPQTQNAPDKYKALWEQYFGPTAQMIRYARPESGAYSPFVIRDVSSVPDPAYEGREISGGDPQLYSGGNWYFNPKTNTFDYYSAKGDRGIFSSSGLTSVAPTDRKPEKSVSAADLGITTDPAFGIAGFATLAGKNSDPWSQYGLTHQKYAATDNPEFWQGAADLRKSHGDILSYESHDPWDNFMDNYAPWVVASIAALPAITGLGVAGAEAGGAAASGTGGITGGLADTIGSGAINSGLSDTLANSTMADLIAGNEALLSSAGYGTGAAAGAGATAGALGSSGGGGSYLSAFGPTPNVLGSGVTNEVGSTLIGETLGSAQPATLGQLVGQSTGAINAAGGATGALIPGVNAMYDFSLGALAPAIPDASGELVLASTLGGDAATGGALSSLSSLKDAGNAILSNAGSIGTLLGALGGKAPQNVSGSSSRPAWMNQGLPSIPVPKYTSNQIQGDPYRYGMGPQQALYTDQSGQVYQPQNFGMVGGQQFGVPIAKAHGGSIHGEGGLSRAFNYVEGGGNGQADDVPAKLSSGEYVMDADIVSALGDGNNDAGAKILDKFRENIRKHKRGAAVKDIPPKAKPVQQYLKGAK